MKSTYVLKHKATGLFWNQPSLTRGEWATTTAFSPAFSTSAEAYHYADKRGILQHDVVAEPLVEGVGGFDAPTDRLKDE